MAAFSGTDQEKLVSLNGLKYKEQVRTPHAA